MSQIKSGWISANLMYFVTLSGWLIYLHNLCISTVLSYQNEYGTICINLYVQLNMFIRHITSFDGQQDKVILLDPWAVYELPQICKLNVCWCFGSKVQVWCRSLLCWPSDRHIFLSPSASFFLTSFTFACLIMLIMR